MRDWLITKIDKNIYKLYNSSNDFIEVELKSTLQNNPEIIFNRSRDMSIDNVIFSPNTYPTPEEDNPVIGDVYQYNHNKCIENGLVEAHIINTNIPNNAKGIVELICL